MPPEPELTRYRIKVGADKDGLVVELDQGLIKFYPAPTDSDQPSLTMPIPVADQLYDVLSDILRKHSPLPLHYPPGVRTPDAIKHFQNPPHHEDIDIQ